MDDQYKDCINKDGKLYRYDHECECWYRVFTHAEYTALPHWDKFGWLYVTAILTVICFIAAYS